MRRALPRHHESPEPLRLDLVRTARRGNALWDALKLARGALRLGRTVQILLWEALQGLCGAPPPQDLSERLVGVGVVEQGVESFEVFVHSGVHPAGEHRVAGFLRCVGRGDLHRAAAVTQVDEAKGL